jgi:hypothetical protein
MESGQILFAPYILQFILQIDFQSAYTSVAECGLSSQVILVVELLMSLVLYFENFSEFSSHDSRVKLYFSENTEFSHSLLAIYYATLLKHKYVDAF